MLIESNDVANVLPSLFSCFHFHETPNIATFPDLHSGVSQSHKQTHHPRISYPHLRIMIVQNTCIVGLLMPYNAAEQSSSFFFFTIKEWFSNTNETQNLAVNQVCRKSLRMNFKEVGPRQLRRQLQLPKRLRKKTTHKTLCKILTYMSW